MRKPAQLPDYDHLEKRGGVPCSWGLWGDDDVFGALNLSGPDEVVAAARLVREGKIFPLNWSLEEPDPPLFARSSLEHEIATTPVSADDHIDGFNTQSSSQWDGFLHIRHPAHGNYNGDAAKERHGIDTWARRGIAGRGVLADVARHREAEGRPIRHRTPELIPFEEVTSTLSAQGTEVRPGDFLLVRTGWIAWYSSLSEEEKSDYANMANFACPGLAPGSETARALWDLHISAICADNPSCEAWPPGSNLPESERGSFWGNPEKIHEAFMHTILLPMLGIPIGEMWYMDDLAEDCATDGRYEFFLTSAPLNLPGGVASPPNALAIK